MTYNPSIPQSTDIISNSQSDILTNFTQLNTQFAIDHTGFKNGGSNGDGFHKKVTFPDATSPVPTAATTLGVLYSILDSGSASQLVFKNKNSTFQLTGSASVSGSQTTVVTPWGLVLKFGVCQGNVAGTLNNFAVPFPTAANGVIVTPRITGAITSGALINSASQFTVYIQAGPGTQDLYFIAWGT